MVAAPYIQNEQEFDSLLADDSVIVVDCTATWCGPCKLVSPLIDRLSEEYGDQAKICKLDLDNNKELAKRLGVKSIPAVMFFKGGELVETLVGSKTYEQFSQELEKHLAN